MTKTRLIEALAARYGGNRRQAAYALESVIDTITREVAKGEKVAITGFGSFEKRVRDARWVRNPRTGERIKAKKTAIPKFSAGADLKAVVSGAKKLPKPTHSAAASGARTAKPMPAKKTATTKKSAAKTATKKSTAKKSTGAKKNAAKKSTANKATTAQVAAKKSPVKKSTPRNARR